MGAMIRSSKWAVIAGLLAVSAVVLLIGLAVAAISGGSDDKSGPQAVATATAVASARPNGTSTSLPAITATSAPPTATARPDSPVSSTPLPPATRVAPTAVVPSGNTTLPISNLPPLPAGTHREEAPIDGLDVLTLESAPPQYMLQIKAGLPSGCAKAAGYEATRSGTTINVKVHNSMPDGNVICTAIYGTYDLNINLGSDYQSGQTYTVSVNDRSLTFRAQ